MSREAWAALAVAIYGALLSTGLAVRQVWKERRRLRVLVRTLVWVQSEGEAVEVLEVRAINESHRPVQVLQAQIVTADDALFLPTLLPIEGARRNSPQASGMITDGEMVTFYFDLLDFDDERLLPKAVEVLDYGDRCYRKRVSSKQRREVARQAVKLRERLGPDVESQRGLVRTQD